MKKTWSTSESWIANPSILKAAQLFFYHIYSYIISNFCQKKKVLGILLNISKKHQMRCYVIPHSVYTMFISLLYTTHTIRIKIEFKNTKIWQYRIGSAIFFSAYSIFSYVSCIQITVLQRNHKAINKLYKLAFLKKPTDLMF